MIDADAFDRMLEGAQAECRRNGGNFRVGVLSTVRANLAKMPTVGGWISVEDRLPENQNPVIVFVPPHVDEIKGTFLGYVGMAYYTSFGEGFWCGTDGNLYGAIGTIHTPTHWMTLPEPPEEVSGNG